MIINPKDRESLLELPMSADQYLLTADTIMSKNVKLNGRMLQLKPDGSLPAIEGRLVKKGVVKVPPYSIMFLTFNNL